MNQDEALSVSERINTRFHDARRGHDAIHQRSM